MPKVFKLDVAEDEGFLKHHRLKPLRTRRHRNYQPRCRGL